MAGLALPGMSLATNCGALDGQKPLLSLVLELALQSVVHVAVSLASSRDWDDRCPDFDAREACRHNFAPAISPELEEVKAPYMPAAELVKQSLAAEFPSSPAPAAKQQSCDGGASSSGVSATADPSIEECSADTASALADVTATLAALQTELAQQDAKVTTAVECSQELAPEAAASAEEQDAEWVLVPALRTEAYTVDASWGLCA